MIYGLPPRTKRLRKKEAQRRWRKEYKSRRSAAIQASMDNARWGMFFRGIPIVRVDAITNT